MKNTVGIVRNIDDLGRVTLPKEYRKSLEIKEGDPVEIQAYGDGILISPCKLQCVCCGDKDEKKLIKMNGVHICPGCIKDAWDKVLGN